MTKLGYFVKNYWSYYLRLESKCLRTLDYVEFNSGNFKTYSFEYLNLLLSVCSEIDVVGKIMAHEKDSDFKVDDKKNNILKWWYKIQNDYNVEDLSNEKKIQTESKEEKRLSEQKVNFFSTEFLQPWTNFEVEMTTNKKGKSYLCLRQSPKSDTPFWWKAYNHVKHNRMVNLNAESGDSNYKDANLKNVAYAFAGLYVLEKAFMMSIADKKEDMNSVNCSKLFEKERYIDFQIENESLDIENKEKMLNDF